MLALRDRLCAGEIRVEGSQQWRAIENQPTLNAHITGVLADVHRWTGLADAFTGLHTGVSADDPRVALAAVLIDATNFRVTRMADACSVASYRKLA